mgnify:CR=1 FL=1
MSDKKFPNPEDIQKEFEEFVQKKFGGHVHVIAQEIPTSKMRQEPEASTEAAPTVKFDLNFDQTPKEIKAHLDKYVIAQDEAKKALAIAVCDHYNQVAKYLKSDKQSDFEYSKQNVLILGPTGVGKTYLVRQVAKLIGVPFVRADATKFSETGYMGANVDDLIRDLVQQAGNDIERAQFGIVYIDEIDKLASAQGHTGRDVSGRGVQLGLLKLMEETDVDLKSAHDPVSQMQAFMEMQQKGRIEKQVVNTRHILFVVSGAFPDLDEIIAKRIHRANIGFASEGDRVSRDDKTELLQHATTQDFVKFGFEPEFVGRLPIRVACSPLDKEKLIAILKNTDVSILRQYQESFGVYNIELSFTDQAIERIAELALEEKTGARALMTVCEKILRDYKFELPSTEISELVVDRDLIDDPKGSLASLLAKAPNNSKKLHKEIRDFERDFLTKYDMQIRFDQEACAMIMQKAAATNCEISAFCSQTLFSFEHGLKLIEQNTKQKEFLLDKSVIENPKSALEKMVKESYNV